MASIWMHLLVSLAAVTVPLATRAQPPARRSFEVAAITPVQLTPAQMAAIGQGAMRIGMNVTETRVEISYMTLEELVSTAFRVQANQISGPAWLRELRFNIQAAIPDGARREQ